MKRTFRGRERGNVGKLTELGASLTPDVGLLCLISASGSALLPTSPQTKELNKSSYQAQTGPMNHRDEHILLWSKESQLIYSMEVTWGIWATSHFNWMSAILAIKQTDREREGERDHAKQTYSFLSCVFFVCLRLEQHYLQWKLSLCCRQFVPTLGTTSFLSFSGLS